MFLSLFTGDLQPGLKMFPLHVKITVTRFGSSRNDYFRGGRASCWNFALSLPFSKRDVMQKTAFNPEKNHGFCAVNTKHRLTKNQHK
jgi:hypothetical protein